jgi:hypothetical protein
MVWFFALLVSLFCGQCGAQIVRAESVPQMREQMGVADGSTLAIFDVDLVLIGPANRAFWIPSDHPHAGVVREVWAPLSSEERGHLWVTLGVYESVLIDPAMPQLVADLQQCCPTMSLTANYPGRINCIQTMADLKIDRLRQFGIDFAHNAPHEALLVFEQLPYERSSYPTYLNGMLFSAGAGKGRALVTFLQQVGLQPARVLFVDDRLDNLQDVEQALLQLNPEIEFVGIHYTAARAGDHLSAEQIRAAWQEALQQALAFTPYAGV